jgi:hypothetical protein
MMADDEDDLFDPTLYPRTYHVAPGWTLLFLALGVPLALAGPLGVGYLLVAGSLAGWAEAFVIAVCAAPSCLAIYGVLYALQYRVILTADAIEVVEPFRRRQQRREEIRGRQLIYTGQGFSMLVFVPIDERTKKLKIPLVLRTDDAFVVWYSEMPDVDRQEFAQSEAELAQRYLDLSPEEQARRTKRLRHLATGVNAAAIALAVGALMLPSDPYHLVFAGLVALPWVAIGMVAVFQPLYRFGARGGDQHPDLTMALITSGFILMLRALSTLETLDWRAPVMLACAGGLALGGAAAGVDPWFRKRRWEVLLLGLLTCSYGYGAGLELNALADQSVPRVFPTKVLEKRVSEDAKWTTWYLTLKPWGPVAEADEVSVSKALYELMRPGDTVCVLLRSGALRIEWYQVATCGSALAHIPPPFRQ